MRDVRLVAQEDQPVGIGVADGHAERRFRRPFEALTAGKRLPNLGQRCNP